MINHCTVYRKDTGEIVHYSHFSCPSDDEDFIDKNHAVRLALFGSEDHAVARLASDHTIHYIADLGDRVVVTEKPSLVVHVEDDKTTIVADGEDSVVLTGLPDPCEIIIDDPDPTVETTVTTVPGGGFVFVADDPGVYSIEIRRFPFLPFLIEITAT